MSGVNRWVVVVLASVRVAVLAALLAAPALAAPPVRAGGIQGTVTHVVDGDSLWITPASGGKGIEVRLAGIDAPEICQEHGAESKQYLAELVLKQPVRLVVGGASGQARDVHGRTLGTVYRADVEVNRRLVEEGMAWSIRVKWDRGPYVPQERMARALSRGVHKVGSAAILPKDFRQRHGPCGSAQAPVRLPEPEPVRATSREPVAAVPAPAQAAGPAPARAAFRCDGRTRCSQMKSCAEATFFLQNCPGVQMDGDRDGVPCEQQWC